MIEYSDRDRFRKTEATVSTQLDEVTQEFQAPAVTRLSHGQLFLAPGVALVLGMVLLRVRERLEIPEVHDAVQALAYGLVTFAVVGLCEGAYRLLTRALS